jgi:hypothetical protein
VTLFAEPDPYQKKQNGPIKSERLFNELFTAPTNRRQIYKDEDSDDQQKPKAPPRRFQTDRPEITDKITVSLAYHPPNDENEKPKMFI